MKKTPLLFAEIEELRDRARLGTKIPEEYVLRLLEERNDLRDQVEHLQKIIMAAKLRPCPVCGLFDHVVCMQPTITWPPELVELEEDMKPTVKSRKKRR